MWDDCSSWSALSEAATSCALVYCWEQPPQEDKSRAAPSSVPDLSIEPHCDTAVSCVVCCCITFQVSRRAKIRGLPQLGTLGAGNHYAEIQVVEEIFDEPAAKKMGINRVGQVGVADFRNLK